MYEYRVVFHPDKSFESARRFSIFPTVRKEPEIVQEDEYCYVVRVTTYSEEKAMKIAKDFLMKTLAEEVNGCTGCGFANYATQDECEECLSWKKEV